MSGPVVVFPEVLEPAAQQRAAHGQQVSGTLTAPEHTGLLEALPYHRLAASLHHSRADEIAGGSQRLIEYLGVVVFKVSNLLLSRFTGLGFGRQVGFSLSDNLSDCILRQPFAPLAIASLGSNGALPVKGGAQEVQMLTGVIVIQDTDCMGKVQAR